MKNKKISLDRSRPERSETRRLSLGKTVRADFSMAPEDKKKLKAAAKERGMSFSLYINLILKGQEKSPL